MKKSIIILFALSLLVSCKSKQAVVQEAAAEDEKGAKEIITGHYNNPKNYQTLLIKANVDYKDKKISQPVTAEIKIKKDETILVSIRFLGITMAKALITPKRVSYYEKLNGTYFDGDYAVLSRWLGTELDYSKVQNMLTGEAIDDLTKGKYKATIDASNYKLIGKESNGTIKEFLFEGANYLLKKEHIEQGGQTPRTLDIQYPSHSPNPQAVLPTEIKIEAQQKDKVTINIQYSSVKFDEKLSFPYEVPQGYDQISID
jgi:hypothetical protein